MLDTSLILFALYVILTPKNRVMLRISDGIYTTNVSRSLAANGALVFPTRKSLASIGQALSKEFHNCLTSSLTRTSYEDAAKKYIHNDESKRQREYAQ